MTVKSSFSKSAGALCRTTQGQFPNFQIHLLERISRRSSSLTQIAGSAELPDLLANPFEALGKDFKHACKTTGSPAFARRKDETVGADWAIPVHLLQLSIRAGA